MRKITILVASILAMVGCAENSKINNENLRPRITMSVDASKSEVEDTRIELASGVYDMLWEENDKIGLFIAGTGEKAVFEMSSLGDDRKSARFSGEIYEPETIDSYYAYYPSNTPFGGSIASFVLPSETTGATAPMLVAMHEETTIDNVQLVFKPVTALLELTLGFAADKVVIESNNGESLAGVYSYNIATSTGNSISGSTSVTLTAPAAGTHYLYMPDVTLAKGYKVTVVVGDNQMIKTVGYNTGKTFVAGEVTPLEISTFEPVSVTLGDVKTSYSYYTAGDSATANSVDGSTVYFTGASTFSGVSSTLVEECGVYCGSKKLVGTISGKSFTATNISGLSWGTHSVCAYVKVNGVEYKSASKNVYITGLPYEADWRSKDYSDWTFLSSNTTDAGSYIKFAGASTWGYNSPQGIISPAFSLPASVNVTTAVAAVTSSTNTKTKYRYMYIAAGNKKSSTKFDGSYVDLHYSASFTPNENSDYDYITLGSTLTLTSSNPCLVYSHCEYWTCSGALFRIRIDYK